MSSRYEEMHLLHGIYRVIQSQLSGCSLLVALFPDLPSIQFSTDETELDYGRPWNEATSLAFKVKVTNIASLKQYQQCDLRCNQAALLYQNC